MKKIKIIKESPFFTHEVGEVLESRDSEVRLSLVNELTFMGNASYVTIDIHWLIEQGYAEFVEDLLEDKVLTILRSFCEERFLLLQEAEIDGPLDLYKSKYFDKYNAIKLYDHIVSEMEEYGEGMNCYTVSMNFNKVDLHVYDTDNHNIGLKRSYKNICQAMIDCKPLRPYLNLIFWVNNE